MDKSFGRGNLTFLWPDEKSFSLEDDPPLCNGQANLSFFSTVKRKVVFVVDSIWLLLILMANCSQNYLPACILYIQSEILAR